MDLSLCEPFACLRLFALEETRLPTKKLKPILNSDHNQFNLVTNLVDECDKIKSIIHVHSFTYDYHMRILHGFISGRPSFLGNGYNLDSFMSDFMNYYSKGPNFARSMVRVGQLSIHTPEVPPEQLFNFLLSHERHYNFGVLRLEPVVVSRKHRKGGFDCDFALTRNTIHRLSFTYPSDLRKTDEFDAALVVVYDR